MRGPPLGRRAPDTSGNDHSEGQVGLLFLAGLRHRGFCFLQTFALAAAERETTPPVAVLDMIMLLLLLLLLQRGSSTQTALLPRAATALSQLL